MEYLTKEDIIFINRKTVKKHGGNFVPPKNLLNEAPLDYLVEVIDSELFGQPIYPLVTDKAAVYMFNIISNHIFQDGNKQTGLAAALLFLKLNGYKLKKKLERIEDKEGHSIPKEGVTPNEILIEFTLEVAAGKRSMEVCQTWFRQNLMTLENG